MILNRELISMVEAKEYLSKDNEKEAELKAFIEKFTDLNVQQAKDLREKISKLEIIKVKNEHISKIIDMLPEDPEDLNKIFTDIGLDDDETKRILDVVKEFKQ